MAGVNLANASALVWLLPLAAVIVALYLLKMRRRDVQVPAVFLWPRRTEEVRANSLFQKLRFSWLLVLQLLALMFILVSLAKPQFKQKGLSGQVTVVVLDASASMGARDIEPSRLESARSMVSDMVNSLSGGDRLALIEAGPTPRVVFPLGHDPVHQLQALRGLHGYDCESDMGESLRLAAAIAGATDGAKIVVLSDGAFEPVADFSANKASVSYIQIGRSTANLGVQALGTTSTPNGQLSYVGVKNFGTEPAASGVSVYADGKVVDSAKLRIGPGQTWGKTVRVPPDTRIVEARLDRGDLLSSDDYGVSVSDPTAQVSVLLVTKGDMFLEKALSLDPRVTLDKAATVPNAERADSTGAGLYDIVVFDGVEEEPVKARATLNFGSAGRGSPVRVSGTARNPTFVSADDHPLLSGVDFDGVYLERQEKVVATGSGQTLAESKAGPLVVVTSGAKRQVYVAFRPLDSDFPLNVGFPLLVGNALDYLIGSESSNLLSLKVGQPFAVPTADASQVTLTRPDGTKVQIPVRNGRAVIHEIDRVGKYQVEAGKHKRTVYASMRSPLESDIAPRSDLEIGDGKVASRSDLSRFEDFWPLALIVALLVLGVEWWMYARRS